MRYTSTVLIAIFLYTSCIPLRVAPNIKEDKIKIAKRFKKSLPKQYALIFNDPKDANEFYNFINTKYQLNDEMVEDNVPFVIDGEAFYFSFYEAEKTTQTINLVPIFLSVALASDDDDDLVFEELHTTRTGSWYIALLATDSQMNDCLAPNHNNREKVIKYLRDLRIEYLNTHNYVEALLKN